MRSTTPLQEDVVRCIECNRVAEGTAHGWKAFVGGSYEGDPIEVLVYCPACADREFGAGA
ncbi:MAG: hypothetical protein ACXVRZ_04135 [Gaiellaceae bacterium]